MHVRDALLRLLGSVMDNAIRLQSTYACEPAIVFSNAQISPSMQHCILVHADNSIEVPSWLDNILHLGAYTCLSLSGLLSPRHNLLGTRTGKFLRLLGSFVVR